ncbi:helix-turn-helix domain-containing protein [Paraburkholderia caribensis]|uniref:helix-turn-helix domain-containing protein n=1 Tax=Paraburkholderia caribensis TaxID=75105 RepID=UPI0007220631|nr:helix-turn-helix transcriptional regulator [Paraburkholderia caribensis]ALP61580.1 XRE family transcriptional regulator [Paraburkholderia caribensis]AUT53195.1 XRE family transcriptional regulator [Paraburkholderia caribensis]
MTEAANQERIFAKRIGHALAQARSDSGMTQEQAAESLGVNTETVSRFERGHTLPPLGRLFELANLYNVAPEALIAGGAERSLHPATDIAAMMSELSDSDREFVREWVAAMCRRLAHQAAPSRG